MAVIDAANAMVTAKAQGLPLMPYHTALADAVAVWRTFGLPSASAARTSNKAPLTSAQAAKFMNGQRANVLINKIVQYMYQRWPDGTTVDEAMDNLGIYPQSTYARFSELKDGGWIVDSGITRPTRVGNDAVVWKFSTLACSLLGLIPPPGGPPKRIVPRQP
jgi:hypothetical protein